MKLTIALLSAAVAVSSAQPHRHAHQHLHEKKRDMVDVDAATEVVYVLNGHAISESEVQEGLKNGTLVLANNGALSSASSPAWTPSSTVAPTTSAAPSTTETPTTSAVPTTTSSSSVYTPPPSSTWTPSSAAFQEAVHTPIASSSASSSSSGATGLTAAFPDGEVDCSDFPSDYGAIPVSWLGLGGWVGVQKPGAGSSLLAGLTNILTVTAGGSCTEGAYCSYACPPGYQKSQWPTTQGSTGQSVGGLLCKNGKLQLTNPDLSTSLCIKGAEQVTIQVQNKLSQNVAVCRTDYPGTESETVPVNTNPGETQELACPNAADYYHWQGASTSAQYYVNPAGVSVEDACQWGSPANPWGNYAPMNVGVGYSNGAAWLSIFQNSPTTDVKQKFTVEIVGDNLSGTCKYSNGQYCSGANYDQCSSTTGCTVSLESGTATFVFSD